MKRYIIKEIATGTESNTNFKGEVHTYYHGKQSSTAYTDDLAWFAKEYGYSTKAAGASAMKNQKENRDWFEQMYNTWIHKLELVEMEV